MKMKDGSEQIRIKQKFAEKIRKDAEAREISFLDMMYVILTDYYFLREKEIRIAPTQEIKQSPKVNIEQKIDESDDESCTLDIEI